MNKNVEKKPKINGTCLKRFFKSKFTYTVSRLNKIKTETFNL